MKVLLFALLATPLVLLGYDMAGEIRLPGSRLGPDAGEVVVETLGLWGIRILLATLAVSSLRRWLSLPRLGAYRRMVGLFAFTYLSCHMAAYLTFLAGFDWQAIESDLLERTYITAGFAGLLLLLPLAVTSTRNWRRRLGRRWQVLHRAVYPAMALGLAHFFWQTKDGFAEVLLYTGIFVLLMLERVHASRTGAPARPRAG